MIRSDSSSRVVSIYREDAVVAVEDGGVTRNEIQPAAVREMVDDALAALTDGAAQPWHVLLPDFTQTTRIGIKANCLNYFVPTSPALIRGRSRPRSTVSTPSSFGSRRAMIGKAIRIWLRPAPAQVWSMRGRLPASRLLIIGPSVCSSSHR